MNEEDIITGLAKSKAMANRVAKKATVAQLTAAIENLKGALDAAKKRDAARNEKRREANIKKLTAMMSDMGLSPADIAKIADGKKPGRKASAAKKTRGAKKGGKVAPKYQIESNGAVIQWTGRGRMPVPFREFVEKGGSLEQCLIQPAA